jgi:outer membrane lipoprotein-sorting protein
MGWYNPFELAMHTYTIKYMAAVLAAASLLSPAATPAQSQARLLADQMVESLGGESFLQVREIHTAGRYFSFSKGELSGADFFVDYIRFPDSERTEFGREKNKTITINKGTEGWLINTREKQVEPQPAGQTEDFAIGFKTSFDYILRFVLNHPQSTIQSLGNEIIDFRRADVLEVRDPAKNLIRFYIDRTSKLPVKMQVRRANERDVREELFANWHRIDGIMTPMFVSRSTDGQKTMEIRLETAAYNSGLSDSLFTPAVPK